MTAVKPKRGFYIAATCPACGAELELQSDFLTTSCASCGSVLRILTPAAPPAYVVKARILAKDARFHVDRHLKNNGQPLTQSFDGVRSIYYPYWKIDAILLRLRHRKETRVNYNEETQTETTSEQKKVETTLSPYDVTIAAGGLAEMMPYGLGERTEYVKTMPYSEEHLQDRFELIRLEMPWSDAVTSASRAVEQLSHIAATEFGENISLLLRPVLSLINFPYLLAEATTGGRQMSFLLDGLTGRVVQDREGSISELLHTAGQEQFAELGRLGVEMHRCGNCGQQLPDTRSFVYICRHCQHLTVLENYPGLRPRISSAQGPIGRAEQFFPFWMFRLPPEQLDAFKIRFGGGRNEGVICIPAFPIKNFEAMYRLTRRMSGGVSQLPLQESLELTEDHFPAAVGVTEAEALAHVVLIRDLVGRSEELPHDLATLPFQEVSLFYAPFHPESYFFVDSCLGAITFEKSLAPSLSTPVSASASGIVKM